MTKTFTEASDALARAANEVVNSWEGGNLAGAVRMLSRANSDYCDASRHAEAAGTTKERETVADTMRKVREMNICAIGINIFDGMNMQQGAAGNFDTITEIWGQGFLELTLYIGTVAIAAEDALRVRDAQDFPGVYDYEVSYPFGKWFVAETRKQCRVPTLDECAAEMNRLADAFFNQGQDK